MKHTILAFLTAFAVSAFNTTSVSAQYQFVAIARYDPRPFQFIQSPAINERGQVTYMKPDVEIPQGVGGLLLSPRNTKEPVVIVDDEFVDAEAGAVNDFGDVAYIQEGVFNSDGRSVRQIEDAPKKEETIFHSAFINERGTVAFEADLDKDGNTALFITPRGGEPIDFSDGMTGDLNFHSPPALDGFDRVAFSAYNADLLRTDIYLYDRGAITHLYDSGIAPNISRHGLLTFTRLAGSGGGSSVYRGSVNGEGPVLIADSRGQFTHVLADAVNDRGQVLFRATFADGTVALCLGDGHSISIVVREGDSLLGKVVSNVSPGSINNQGQIAMEAFFTDDSAAVVRATPAH